MNIRDRIKELRRVPAESLRPNPKNWRLHPPEQVNALKGLLSEIGYAGAALARELPDGTLELIDGHARAEVTGGGMMPVLVLDVSEAEADKILATFDPIGTMADADTAKLDALLATVSTENSAVKEMLSDLATDVVATEVVEEKHPRLQAIIDARKNSAEKFKDRVEVNFWTCLVFQSYEQKMEFLKQVKAPVLYGMYVDGQELATELGYKVTPNSATPISSPLSSKLSSMAMGSKAGG